MAADWKISLRVLLPLTVRHGTCPKRRLGLSAKNRSRCSRSSVKGMSAIDSASRMGSPRPLMSK